MSSALAQIHETARVVSLVTASQVINICSLDFRLCRSPKPTQEQQNPQVTHHLPLAEKIPIFLRRIFFGKRHAARYVGHADLSQNAVLHLFEESEEDMRQRYFGIMG